MKDSSDGKRDGFEVWTWGTLMQMNTKLERILAAMSTGTNGYNSTNCKAARPAILDWDFSKGSWQDSLDSGDGDL